MPRLRDRRVLDEGIVDLPLIWQTDAFALASDYDESAARYVGLWTPDDGGPAPVATDSLLLVRPDLAVRQRAAEQQATRDSTVEPDGPDTPDAPTPRPDISYPAPKVKTRFYGVKTLGKDRFALDFRNIADEVLAHLRESGTARLTVRLEIEATDSAGFDEAQIRTVSENARTLKFDAVGFEDD